MIVKRTSSMRTVRFLLCAGYCVLLTVLLLAPDPAALVRLSRGSPLLVSQKGIHFVTFTILALLVHAVRWPQRVNSRVVATLLVYGIATESLQAFVPSRTVGLLDYTENTIGIAVGTGVYWLVQRLVQQHRQGAAPETGPAGERTSADAPCASQGRP
jgi:VanZ family protein